MTIYIHNLAHLQVAMANLNWYTWRYLQLIMILERKSKLHFQLTNDYTHVTIKRLTQMKIWSSHLLDNLSNCLMNLKNSGDSTGFEPMTSAMPVQCSNQLSY